jgi:hypothetical protein
MKSVSNITKQLSALPAVVLLLLSSSVMLAQESQSTGLPISEANVQVASAAQSNSQMELVMWIMGSQTRVMSNHVTNTISTNGTEKKKYINVGMTPNRVLIKTIFKKAAFRSNMVA